MARRELTLTGYAGTMVLVPSPKNEKDSVEALRITVFGPNFPQRAVEPELMVGKLAAQRVTIARDQRSLHGYFFGIPASGSRIRVRYGESQEGVLRAAFRRSDVRPLPAGCRG
jgi:hypothetical protein